MDARQLALNGLAVEVGQGDAFRRQHGHVAIGQKVDIAGVMQDAGHVGGDKGLALAHADHNRRAGARGHNLVRLRRGENAQRKGAGEALDRRAHRVLQLERRTCGLRVFLHLLNQVGNDLGVGFGDELVPLGGELAFQLQVILNNAVVHHHNASGAVAVRMRILLGGPSVRGPARVPDAVSAVQRFGAERVFQILQLARRPADLQQRCFRSAHGDPGRIVAAVFQPAQSFDDDRNHVLAAHISHNAAHEFILSGREQGIGNREFLEPDPTRSCS